MSASKSSSRFIAITGIAVAFTIGCLVAKIENRVPPNDLKYGKKTEVNHTASFGDEPRLMDARAWKAKQEHIIKIWEKSPFVRSDYVLIEETHALLERVSTNDLEKWIHECRSRRYVDHDWDIEMRLQELIIISLIKRNPERTIKFLTENSNSRFELGVSDVIYYWIENDPMSALAWIEKDEIPSEIEEDRDYYIENAIEKLAVKNPSEFEKRLNQISPEMRVNVLDRYAYNTGTESRRDELLKRASTSEHDEAMALWLGLLTRESEKQPEQAHARLEQLDISAADYIILDQQLLEWILGRGHNADKANRYGYMKAWLIKNPDQDIPSVMLESFKDSLRREYETSIDWVTEELPEVRYDPFAGILVENQLNYYETDYSGIIKIADRIKDPTIRLDAQRLIKKSWQEKDSVAATQWEKNLPASDQEKLK